MRPFLLSVVAAAAPLILLAGAARAQQQPDASATPAASAAIDASASSDDQEDASALAKKLQNPIGNLISVPFQSNTNFSYGPNHGTQELVNIQPVIPFHLGDNWNVITRTILPLIWQPSMAPLQSVPFGTGATTFSAFLSPSQPTNGWLWGFGPATQIPTASDPSLGSNVWGLGPTGVLVYMKGPWVVGALANNIWSLGGDYEHGGGTKYNNFLLQPFINFNMKGGWYVGTSPILTANWLAAGNNAWTIPLGMNVGRVIKLGKLPINLSGGAYANVVHPDFAATWQLRTQITFIF